MTDAQPKRQAGTATSAGIVVRLAASDSISQLGSHHHRSALHLASATFTIQLRPHLAGPVIAKIGGHGEVCLFTCGGTDFIAHINGLRRVVLDDRWMACGPPTILRTINKYNDWIGSTDAHLTPEQEMIKSR